MASAVIPVDVETRVPRGDAPLVHRFFARAEATPHEEAFAVYPAGAASPSARLTWGSWCQQVQALAIVLLDAGVAPGDRVAVLAGNRPVWPIADLAIQALGAVGVGLYPSSAPAQIDALLADSGACWLITDDATQARRLAAAPNGGDLRGVVLDTHEPVSSTARLQTLASVLDAGAAQLAQDPTARDRLTARRESVTPDHLAALIYTSGSTGIPKGACITHRYLAASAESIAAVLDLTAADRGLSFLPYSHAAERIFGQCTRILVGMPAALIEDPSDLFPVAAHYEPTLFGALPRIFERLYEAAEVAEGRGEDPRAAMAQRIGTRVRLATSGGAALPIAVAERLDALGLRILGAYGQTEHLCVAMNRPAAPRFDTVGPPMPGTQLRVDEQGELLIARSALTFSGYWRRAEETAAAFTADGAWLRTGDQAALLPDGAVRITGRVKELIALSTGRKVAPLPIEAALTATPLIAHAVVHGEGRKYLVALVSLRREMVEQWAASRGLALGWPDLATHPAVEAEVQAAVATVNTDLARTDRVQAVAMVSDVFTPENGLLTPTLKVIRRAVEARYVEQFDALYRRGGGGP
ncbi:MAG: AMP-dependent synthetase/ligase [Gemmatimonadaceae bacterium]|nr:AMP-dependent synthetase/ligase [Gemmatimonadaceae bacterium]